MKFTFQVVDGKRLDVHDLHVVSGDAVSIVFKKVDVYGLASDYDSGVDLLIAERGRNDLKAEVEASVSGSVATVSAELTDYDEGRYQYQLRYDDYVLASGEMIVEERIK